MTEETVSDRVAAKIREFRKMRHWSMSELAIFSGLSENIVENIESGRRDAQGRRRRNITVDELQALADGLGIPVLALLRDSGDAEISAAERMVEAARHLLNKAREHRQEAGG